MSKLLTFDENTTLKIGQFYNVKCAKMSNGSRHYFVPIIGEAHTDKQIGFEEKHHHIDGRFVSIHTFDNSGIEKDGTTNHICSYPPSSSRFTIEEIVIKRRKCKRLTTGLNPPKKGRVDYFGQPIKSKYWDWADSMIGKSCKGKRCPHLGTKMIEQNGKLFCPLHNLEGSVKTEKITGVHCKH